jgi:outer membrane autotransporter protein
LLDAGIVYAGAARLTSTMVGGYSLLSSGNWYLGSAIGSAWGRNESRDFVLGSTSDYDTSTFVAAGILGNVVPINDNLRFDVRGTLAYQRTVGDAHVDSLGIAYGEHAIEAANATLSGRLFGLFRQGALTIRPYLQAGITHRLHYDNEVEIDGVGFIFEDSDTSIFAATGLDFDIDRSLQLSAGVRHEHSSDVDSLTARFGVVLKLN